MHIFLFRSILFSYSRQKRLFMSICRRFCLYRFLLFLIVLPNR
nr:MAG TPA: hypothetical protein [Caudoviricetes sp.]